MQAVVTSEITDPRPTIRCESCKLMQFVTVSGNCRKCGSMLFPATPAEEFQEDLPCPSESLPVASLADRIRLLRLNRNMGQRDLAANIGVPRTYISKVENGKAAPTLTSLRRIAAGLNVTVSYLLDEAAPASFMTEDPFLHELASVAPQLTDIQRDAILGHARGMVRANKTLKGTA